MTIVCATHFSPSSSNAVALAALLAQRSSERLMLASVQPTDALGNDHAVDLALHREADLLRKQGVEVETAVLWGKVNQTVARQCRAVGAGLLVVGQTGHKTPHFRPTAVEALVSDAPVPLLVVRSQEPLETWAKGTRPLKVMWVVDETWAAEGAQEWLGRMARYGALDVAAHVWGSAPATLQLEGLPGNVTSRVTPELGRGRSGAAVLALAAQEGADVVLLGAHAHRGLLGRSSSGAHLGLGAAPVSVAVLPVAEAKSARSAVLPQKGPVLFVHQRRGALSLGALAVVLAASIGLTALAMKVYRDGAAAAGACQVVCRGP